MNAAAQAVSGWCLQKHIKTEKDEHRTSNVQHQLMNKKIKVEQRMVIEKKMTKQRYDLEKRQRRAD